jgi:hypothetical protein
VKFAEGLAKIDVQNQIIFLFDNDSEGIDAYNAVRRFNLPHNMRTLVLPELEEFRQFPARGPDGVTNSDINGRAAAIECYLDLNLQVYGPAKVVWTNYKKERDVYQGALEFKESYARAFLDQTAQTIRGGSYDVRKLDECWRRCSSDDGACCCGVAWMPWSGVPVAAPPDRASSPATAEVVAHPGAQRAWLKVDRDGL